jgi:hypothetical protein
MIRIRIAVLLIALVSLVAIAQAPHDMDMGEGIFRDGFDGRLP